MDREVSDSMSIENDPVFDVITPLCSVCLNCGDRIKTKNGRIGTVMGIYTGTTGLEVEFDDTAPSLETIDIKDIIEIIKDAK